jgi:hypothetical protein
MKIVCLSSRARIALDRSAKERARPYVFGPTVIVAAPVSRDRLDRPTHQDPAVMSIKITHSETNSFSQLRLSQRAAQGRECPILAVNLDSKICIERSFQF